MDGHNAGGYEHPFAHFAKGTPPQVGVDPVDEVIEQVVQDGGACIGALYLEDCLHHIAPAEQHRPLVLLQRRPPLGHKPLDNGRVVRQPVLQSEVVDGLDGSRLVQEAEPVRCLLEPGIQPPGKARTVHEGHQLALEVPAACHQLGDLGHHRGGIAVFHYFFLPALPVCSARKPPP
ncbi:hypothetical protein [Streptomyces sp. NPDC056188]|uniref:hypothetical protein n=1 Tax=Streptomyces sp. NPDC056188 TaxID=3345740 RepID=UPI0035D88355